MSFSGNYMCTSFKVQLFQGVHDFPDHVFKLALYTEDAVLTAATTAYTTTEEIPATGDYTTGGVTLTPTAPVAAGTAAVVSFAPLTLAGAQVRARGALIYNSTVAGNPAVAVLDFGLLRGGTASGITISFPLATATNAILRVT